MKKLRRNLTKILTTAAVVAIAFGISLLNPLAQLTNGLRSRVVLAATAGEITRRPTLSDVNTVGIKPNVANMPKSTAKLGDTLATALPSNPLTVTVPDFTSYTFEVADESAYTLDATANEAHGDSDTDGVIEVSPAKPEVRVFSGLPATRYDIAKGTKPVPTTYESAGNYEYRFYLGEHFADDQYFDSVTVTVSKSQYSFSSPITGNNENFIPTTLPKGTTELKFPFPDKVNVVKDGTTIDLMDKKNLDDLNEFFKEYGATKFDFTKANFADAIKQLQTYVRVSVYPSGGDTIIKNFTDTATTVTFAFGPEADKISTTATELDASYQLLNKPVDGAVLLSTQLTQIAIKDFGKNDISFTGTVTPGTPTVSWGVETTLPQPTIGTATPNDTTKSLNVPSTEAYTKVVSVKYKTNQQQKDGAEWESITPITASNETIELLGGLKVRALKVGYYQFKYQTTTKWGYRHKDSDDNFVAETGYIEYETAPVQVSYNSTATSFIWTDAYTLGADGKPLLSGADTSDTADDVKIDDISDLADFAKYLPTTNGSAEKPNTVDAAKGLIVPALYAENSILRQDQLDYRITIASVDNGSLSTGNYEQYHIYSSKGYDPTQKLYITFDNQPTDRNNIQQYNVKNGATSSANKPNTDWEKIGGFMSSATSLLGKYSITMSVYSRNTREGSDSMNPDSSYTTGSNLISQRTYYFTVENTQTTVPTIGEINIDNHYMMDSDTLTVNVPANLFADDYTMSANIDREYILNPVNNGTLTSYEDMVAVGTTGIKIDETPNSSGALTIDLTKYEDKIKFHTTATPVTNTLRVVAKGFNQMQKELYNDNGADDINTITDTFYKDVTFKIYDLDSPIDNVNYTFNGGSGASADFGAELWEKTGANGSPVYAQNENIYLPEIIAQVLPDAEKIKTQLSVAVFQMLPVPVVNDEENKFKHNFTNIYRDYENVPTVVGAPEDFTTDGTPAVDTASEQFANMYFTPSTAGDYFVFITTKATASDAYSSFLVKITVKPAGRASITTNGGSTALVVGEKGFIPNVTLNVIDNKITGSDKELKEADGTPVGYYNISIRGMGANDIIRGDNSIIAKRDGVITVVYDFYFDDDHDKNTPYTGKYSECDGGNGEPLTYPYNITVSAISAADLDIGVNEEYDDIFPVSKTSGINPDYDPDTNANPGTTAGEKFMTVGGEEVDVMGLNNFMFSGVTSFSVDRSKTNPLWEENLPVYPLIAIPNLNVQGRTGVTLYENVEDPDIKVTYLDNSGVTQTLIDTANDDETKRLLKGSVKLNNGYYAFKPQGVFVKLNGDTPESHNTNDRYLFNNENFIYTLTYTTYYGSSEPITKTFTIKTGDRQAAVITVGDVGKRLNDDGTPVETDPLVYTYKTDMDAIKLDISKISVSQNANFQEYMENWILDNYEVDENGDPKDNNRANNITALTTGGYYDPALNNNEGGLTDAGIKLSRARYIGKYIMVYITINGKEWAFNELYATRHYMNSTSYDSFKAHLDNNMQKQDYIPSNGGTDTYIVGTDGVEVGDFEKTVYTFKPTQAATYAITFSIYNEFTQSTASANVTVAVNADDSVSSDIKNDAKKIWGWILIILSSGLLIGVVFYFIKTGRDTKFGGTPKPEGKKIKASKEANAPKADEAPVKEKTEEKEAK